MIDPAAFRRYAGESPALAGRDYSPDRRVRVVSSSGSSTSGNIARDSRGDEEAAVWADYDQIDPKTRTTLTDHQYFLFPRRIDGFAFKLKRWMGFDIEGMKPLTWSPDESSAMSQLILPRRDIEIIKALSSKNEAGNASSWGADFIPGKGEGQVFLLHGKWLCLWSRE
jgi:hypothetical protein